MNSTDKDEAKRPRKPGRPSERRAVRQAAASAFDRITPPDSTTGQLAGQESIPLEEAPAKTPKTSAPIRSMTVRLYDQRDSEALDKWMSKARGRVEGRPAFDRLAREMIRILASDPVISELVMARMAEDERPAGSRKRRT